MSVPKLFDAHTHVQFHAFENDFDAVIKRALDAGVWMVNVGTQQNTSQKAVEIANQYPAGVYATVGLHPIHTEKSYHDAQELGDSTEAKGFTSRGEEFDYEYYRKLAQDRKVVAIGECGLDYYRLDEEKKEKQVRAFIKQIELAHDTKKPLMIHCRDAYEDLISILKANSYESRREVGIPTSLSKRFNGASGLKAPAGIVHFFSGTQDDAKKFLDMGFSFSFGGVITFPLKTNQSGVDIHDYNEIVDYIPLDRILLETDAPYVAPVPYRGQRNEPVYVIEVAKKIAELKRVDFEEVARQTTINAKIIFGL